MRTAHLIPAVLALGCNTNKEDESAIQPVNHAPVADAGSAIVQSADEEVRLDGSASYDPDGDPIAYTWSFDTVPEGSALADVEDPFPGNGTTSATTQFWADAAGTWVVKLVVKDNHGAVSDPAYVVIEITEGEPPVADAGPDLEGTEGDVFTLDGSGSYDSLGRDLSYAWTFAAVPDGSGVTSLTNADSPAPSFTADKGGVYIASLVVNNGIQDSAPDTTIIRVASADPQPPVAIVEEKVEGSDCTAIELDGSGSYDPNDDPLTYQWSLQSKPAASSASDDDFSDRNAATTTFLADEAGEYLVSLSVFDGTSWSAPAFTTLELSERSYNSKPVVDAGTPQSIDAGSATCTEDGYTYDCDDCSDQIVDLGADASATDPDGDALRYEWTVDNDSATIADSSSLQTTATLTDLTPTEPGSCEETEFTFTLTVTDCTGESTSDTVTYTATCCGLADTGSRR